MKPIEDFELVYCSVSRMKQEADRAGLRIISPVPPSHPRLRVAVDSDCHFKLHFRGAVVEHLQIEESELVAQFEAESGYVLFVAEDDVQAWQYSTLAIYYVLKDFSGAEYGFLTGWDDSLTRWQRVKYKLSMIYGWMYGWGEYGPEPLKQVHPVNDQRIEFEVSGMGWYSLTLHECPPRRFLFSSSTFVYMNSGFWHTRYCCVRRLPDGGVGRKGTVDRD